MSFNQLLNILKARKFVALGIFLLTVIVAALFTECAEISG